MVTMRAPRALASAAPACLAALLWGAALAGCGTSTAAEGPAIPASMVPRLAAMAERAATINGDASPVWVTAVLTTRAKALTSATPGDLSPGADGVPAYLVTMYGRFTAYAASRPPGAKAPAGRYLSLIVDARTLREMDFGISENAPPVAPASLGPVIYLLPRHHLAKGRWPPARGAAGGITPGEPRAGGPGAGG
jgi:hypothetical protein